jgi:hypothetical protein
MGSWLLVFAGMGCHKDVKTFGLFYLPFTEVLVLT